MSEEGSEEQTEPGKTEPVSPPHARARVGRPTKLTQEVATTIISAIKSGCMRYQACALAGIDRSTLRDWEKRAASGDEDYMDFVRELELAQGACEARLMMTHNALANAKATYRQKRGEEQPTMTSEDVPVVRAQLEAIQFQLRNGGTRPWAELKKMELTGKDGEPLRGSEVTPEAAAAMVREAFGEQARRELEAREAAPEGDDEQKPGP